MEISNDELLISLVEECPHLYKKGNAHIDEQMKENSWISIGNMLQSDSETVKKRWTNLRDRFVRAYRHYSMKLPSRSAAVPKFKSFPYMEIMMWLAPHLRKRKVTSLTSTKMHKINTMEDASSSTKIFKVLKIDTSMDEAFKSQLSEDILTSPSGTGISSPHSRPSSSASAKESAHESIIAAMSTFSKFLQHKMDLDAVSNGNTSDINFMKSVVADMKFIEPKQNIKFKLEVMQLLYKYTEHQMN